MHSFTAKYSKYDDRDLYNFWSMDSLAHAIHLFSFSSLWSRYLDWYGERRLKSDYLGSMSGHTFIPNKTWSNGGLVSSLTNKNYICTLSRHWLRLTNNRTIDMIVLSSLIFYPLLSFHPLIFWCIFAYILLTVALLYREFPDEYNGMFQRRHSLIFYLESAYVIGSFHR